MHANETFPISVYLIIFDFQFYNKLITQELDNTLGYKKRCFGSHGGLMAPRSLVLTYSSLSLLSKDFPHIPRKLQDWMKQTAPRYVQKSGIYKPAFSVPGGML